MPALLYCRTGPMAGVSFSLDTESTVGRTAENSVKLSDDRISGRHARIWPDPDSGEWMIEDLESSNGTLVDGSSASEPVQLGDLSVITFAGRFDFVFQVVDSPEVSAPAARASAEPAAARSDATADAPGDIATQAGGTPPGLPDTGDDDVRTKVGGAAPSLPDVKADDAPEHVRTRLGGDAPSLPDVDSGDDSGDDEIHTKIGGGAPDLPETGDSGRNNDDLRTRPGGAPPDLPDSGGTERDDGTRTHASGAPPSLPNVSDPTETIGPGEGARTPGARASEQRQTSVILKLHSSEMSGTDTEFELGPGEHAIGRSSDCDIRIDDASLSRRHAVLTVGDKRIMIRDEGSKNGTYVDGEKVTGERTISPENRLRFGFRMEAWISLDQGP